MMRTRIRSFSHCTCRSWICAIDAGCATCHGSNPDDGDEEDVGEGPGLKTADKKRSGG